MAEQLGEAVLRLSVDDTALNAGLQRAQRQAGQAGEAIGQAFTKSGKPLQTAANGLQFYIDAQGRARDASGKFVTQLQLQEAGLEGIGRAANDSVSGLRKLAVELGALEAGRRAVSFVVDELRQLDAGQAAVRTLGVNSEELTTGLRALSQELKASVSVNELLKASYDVLSSGFTSAADSVNILRAAALGAQGGFAQTDDVVRALTGVLNAYSLSSSEALRITDTFLQTQNDGVITVAQYAAEIGNVASIAAASGVSLEELNAAISTATLRGVPVAQTFTGIRQALASIIKPSEQARDLAQSLGIDYSVAALQSKGFAGVLADVQAKAGGATDKLAILLGSLEAQAAIQPLLNDRLAKYNELLAKQQQSAGAAAEASTTNANTISGNVAKIGNAFSNLATTLDSTLNPIFGTLAQNTSETLNNLNQILSLVPKEAGTLNGAIASSLIFGPGVGLEAIRGSLRQGRQPQPSSQSEPLGPPVPERLQKPATTAPPTDPNLQANIRLANEVAALELRNTQQRIQAARELNQLDEVGRLQQQNRLALSEKQTATEALRLQLAREQEKPADDGTGRRDARSPQRIAELQNQIKKGEAEITLQRQQQEQAEAAAVRSQQERFRLNRIEAANAADKLRVTQELTTLEQQAAIRQTQVSATAVLQLQQQAQLAEKLRQQDAARAALATELARPPEQQDRVVIEELQDRIRRSNQDVVQAYADAGLQLVRNARTAADALKGAQQNLSSIQRGGFEFLNRQIQQQEINRARAAIQPLVNRGVIREGIDISTPDKLFRLASFAEQLAPAQKQLEEAVKENALATKALADKDWQVNVNVRGASGTATGDVVGAINGGL